ncbi:MAG: hypothetical protein ACE5FO_04010 [Parvularculaceae bacterium]
MSNAGIPDILSFTRLSRAVTNVKAQADTARTEAVTGRVEDVTKETGGEIGAVHLIKKAVEDSQAYQRSLSFAENIALRTQTVLGRLTADSNRVAVNAVSQFGVGDEAALRSTAKDASGALLGIFSALNTTDGGRALFSGDAVDRPPLGDPEMLLADVQAIIAGAPDAASAEAALDTYFNDPAGGFQTAVYTGGAGTAPTTEIAPGVRVDASVKADAQPIKDLIRGLAVIASFETAPAGGLGERDKLLRAAGERTLSAESPLSELRAAVGVAEQQIGAAKERHQMEETALTSLLNSKTLRDPFEAASQLQLLESQLEASFLMSARIARLSLANFIR